jgi:hypothetical protein
MKKSWGHKVFGGGHVIIIIILNFLKSWTSHQNYFGIRIFKKVGHTMKIIFGS